MGAIVSAVVAASLVVTSLHTRAAGSAAVAEARDCAASDWTPAMLHASGDAINDMGNYYECTQLGDEADYCVFSAAAAPLEGNLVYSVGLCTPKNCTPTKEIEKWVNFTETLGGGKLISTWNCESDTKRIQNKNTAGTIAMQCVLSILGCLVIVGTGLEYFYRKKLSKPVPYSLPEDSNSVQLGVTPKKVEIKPLAKFFLAWSCYSNAKSLLGHHESPTNFLNGVRVLSIWWVMLGHCAEVLVSPGPGVVNMIYVDEKIIPSANFFWVFAAYYSVDTFFFMSGFLIAYLLLKDLAEKGRNHPNYFLYYFHRYWRLTPSYALILFASITVIIRWQRGPFAWRIVIDGVELANCEQYWWTNLLYINNFYPWSNNYCISWSWYLANDMQFYIVAPLFLVLFHRKPKFSLCLVCVSLLTCWTLDGYLTWISQWHDTNVYNMPYTRAPPFLFGFLLAFLIVPQNTKIVKIQQWSNNLIIRYTLYSVSAALLVSCSFLNWLQVRDTTKGDTWSMKWNSVYAVYSKLGWGLGLLLLFGLWLYGHGGFVSRILAHRFWTPLAKLTYGAYLLHPMIISMWYCGMWAPMVFTSMSYVGWWFGTIILSTFGSFILFLLCERPATMIEPLLLSSLKKLYLAILTKIRPQQRSSLEDL
ncbi:transmembrane protein NRF-6 [Pelomyxa schiedti]|nr:transmembrane protein NRF-6 [Pelomyxa schiedti]